ncbi:MAG: methionine--tRNA ligase [Syntrophaceae bacterium]|nr:methionine--tRNA ligase [Syntrophaceae bacterium]
MSRTLVTSALPYANGDIHIGHLVEYIQTDIFVRFLRLIGEDVLYVCASDAHGAPIEINAAKKGMTPQKLVEEFHQRHRTDFSRFEISFDEFYSTDTPENQRHSEIIYLKAKENNHIVSREIEQFYCERCGRFLPDRYIKGTCPKCAAPDQYGDVCESCGATYRPTELSDAHCAICGAKPELRTSLHLFFKLMDFSDFLSEWTSFPGRLQDEVRGFVRTWIDQGLRDWDISRDGPYFGFKIPGEENKFFYVWLDAPIGYIAATEHYCSGKDGLSVEDYWIDPKSEIEIHHFIGKDIAYFHTLFWPAMLKAADYRTPTAVHVHGFLTVDSRKMSKSRGTFITARQFADQVNPWFLRYFYMTKLGSTIDDIDLNLEEFVNRTNAELVNNITNLISRSASFLNKRLDSMLGVVPKTCEELKKQVTLHVEQCYHDYKLLKYSNVIRNILAISDIANNYVQQNEPWSAIKTDPEKARDDLTFAINCSKILSILLKPVLPSYSAKVEQILGLGDLKWADAKFDFELRPINVFEKLVDRLEPNTMQHVIEKAKDDLAPEIVKTIAPEFKEEILIEDFTKIDLRVGKILSASHIEGSDKLVKLRVDIGREIRTVFAGIKSSYSPEDLVGRTVSVVCNLAPRKMRFGVSEAMVMAASGPDGKIILCELDSDAVPGSIIK